MRAESGKEVWTEPPPDPPRRFCRECGCQLTEQEVGLCSHCYRVTVTEQQW